MGEDFFEAKPSAGDRIAAIRAKTIELATLLVSAPVAEMEVLLEDLRESDGGRPMSAAIIELAVSRSRDGGLTHDELIVACRNVGYDLIRRLDELVHRYPFHAYGLTLTAICVAASLAYSCAH